MINVDDRIFEETNADQFWLLVHITKRLGKEMFCFPSNKTLMSDTGWKIEKLQRVKKELQDKGLIKAEVRVNDGRQSSNNYHLTTDLLGCYVTGSRLSKGTGISDTPPLGKTDTPPLPEKQTTEVLTINEVLINEQIGDSFSISVIDQFNNVKKEMGINGKAKWSKPRAKQILALKKQGITIEQMASVIKYICGIWNNEKMRQHITPDTIFRPSNFPKYLEAVEALPEKDWTERRSPGITATEVKPNPSSSNFSW